MNNVQSGQLNNEPLVKGVMYTRDVMCNRPYYMIQYTDETGHNRSKLIAKNISREFLTERCYELVRIAKEIEEAFPETDAFAISFRIDKGDKVTVLGNRPLEEINNMARHMTDKEFNDTKSLEIY